MTTVSGEKERRNGKKKSPPASGCAGELERVIKKLGQVHSTWQVFEDFLALSAFSISNAVDWGQAEKREAEYMEIVKRYSHDELEAFAEMLALLVGALQYHVDVDGPTDVLGTVFHDLELHNKYRGQFFTPQHICTMMGKMSVGENDKTIERNGFISLCEPCAGSGAMVLGMAQALKDAHYNYCEHMVVTAIDIDIKCVYMTYLQLSLYGIPAVVVHGNSITGELWSCWYTPVYVIGGWTWRKSRSGEEAPPSVEEPPSMAGGGYDLVLHEDESGQLSLI